MKCCDTPSWAMWHPGCREVVAYGCRKCGSVQMLGGRELLYKWAIEDWREQRHMLNHPEEPAPPQRRDYKERAAKIAAEGKKFCIGCGKDLPLDEFKPRQEWDKQGHQRREARCRPCHLLMNQNRGKGIPVVTHKQTPDLPEGKRQCTRCKEVLPIELFWPRRDRRAKPGDERVFRVSVCKPCSTIQRREEYTKKMLKKAQENR